MKEDSKVGTGTVLSPIVIWVSFKVNHISKLNRFLFFLKLAHRLVGLVVRRPPRERKIPGSNPACAGIFSGSSHTSDLKIGTPVATCQAPDAVGSELGLVGPVSVYCDWVRWKVWSATFISVWQHVNLSEQIRPWDTLACCWDIKRLTTNLKHAEVLKAAFYLQQYFQQFQFAWNASQIQEASFYFFVVVVWFSLQSLRRVVEFEKTLTTIDNKSHRLEQCCLSSLFGVWCLI